MPEEENTASPLTFSNVQLAELKKLACAQERTVNEVAGEAIDRYIKDKQWEDLKRYGRAKARELKISEADVPRLIVESREERGH